MRWEGDDGWGEKQDITAQQGGRANPTVGTGKNSVPDIKEKKDHETVKEKDSDQYP